MTSNAEREMRWIQAWSDLYDILDVRRDVRCLLPDGSVVSVEDCKGWLQESAYDNWHVKVVADLTPGAPGVIASRWR